MNHQNTAGYEEARLRYISMTEGIMDMPDEGPGMISWAMLHRKSLKKYDNIPIEIPHEFMQKFLDYLDYIQPKQPQINMNTNNVVTLHQPLRKSAADQQYGTQGAVHQLKFAAGGSR